MKKHHLALASCALLFLFGCEVGLLPTAPADLTSGVAVFEHADYAGESALITQDEESLRRFKGHAGISPTKATAGRSAGATASRRCGLRLLAGCCVRDDGFKGEQLEISADVPNLTRSAGRCSKGGFNDCVTSIRVFRPQ